MSQSVDRRSFLAAGGIAAAGLTSTALGATRSASDTMVGDSLIKPGDTVLFQGDSITDTGRNRENSEPNNQAALGNGYALLASTQLLVNNAAADVAFYNKGISGNKVFQLAERWDKECLHLQPNVLSILIGINDLWHTFNSDYDGTAEVYLNDYDALLTRTKQALPETKIVLCEPFLLKCGTVLENEKKFYPEIEKYRAAAREMADKYADAWVPFQAVFDRAVKVASPEYWAGDGVHPTAAGAALMADAWLRAVTGSGSSLGE